MSNFIEFPINGIDNKLFARIEANTFNGQEKEILIELQQVTLIKLSTQARAVPVAVMQKLPIGTRVGKKMTSFSIVIRNGLEELAGVFVNEINAALGNVKDFVFSADSDGNLIEIPKEREKTAVNFTDLTELPIMSLVLINTPQDGNIYKKTIKDVVFIEYGDSEDAASTENNTFTQGLALGNVTKWEKQ